MVLKFWITHIGKAVCKQFLTDRFFVYVFFLQGYITTKRIGRKWFQNVATCLNGGNVIFESDVTDRCLSGQKVFEVIKEKFELEIPIFVTTEKP